MDILTILKSRTFQTAVVTFLINGTNSIIPFLPAAWQAVVNAIALIAITYFHINPSQNYNKPPHIRP